VTGDALFAKEPAQAGFETQTEAPKSTNVSPTQSLPTDNLASIEMPADTGDAPGVLSTAHPKPEKRKNARERAMEKFKTAKEDVKSDAKNGTKPMTAEAKFKAEDKAAKAKEKVAQKAKDKAQKADTKARKISAAKAAKAARAA
jgi:hypothetical protein